MAWRGSLSRSVLSNVRSSSSRSSPRLFTRPPPVPRFQRRSFSFSNPRTLGELGCSQSLLPLHNIGAAVRLTSYVSINARACCELSQGRNGKDG